MLAIQSSGFFNATYVCSAPLGSRSARMPLPGANANSEPPPTAAALAVCLVSLSNRKVSMYVMPAYAGLALERRGRTLRPSAVRAHEEIARHG